MEEVNQKLEEALEDITLTGPNNCPEQWKTVSIGAFHPMERTVKVTDV